MRVWSASVLSATLLGLVTFGMLSACGSSATLIADSAPSEPTVAMEPVRNPEALPTVPLWTHKGKSYFGSGPIPAGNRLIFPTRKGKLEYVDPNSGKRTAEVKAKYALDLPPVLADGRLFVVTESPRKRLQALAVASGKRLWHRDFRLTLQPPIEVGEELWVPVGDTVVALTPDNGERIRVIVSGGDWWLTPSAGPGGFALLGESGTLRYLDSSGSVLWQLELDAPCAEPPLIHGPDIIVATANGSIVQVRGSGEEVWRRKLADNFLYEPTWADSIIYVVGRSGTLWALDSASGDTVWTQTLGAPGAGSALVRGDWLAATTVDGKLWFLDRRDGTVRDSVVFDALIHHPPVWAFGRLYVVTADKRAHAFGMGP